VNTGETHTRMSTQQIWCKENVKQETMNFKPCAANQPKDDSIKDVSVVGKETTGACFFICERWDAFAVEEDVVTPAEIGVVKKLVEGGTWKADCEAKFMKVLSGHAANEAALKMEEGTEPCWNALVKLVKARFPGQDPAWAREVVDNCKHFLNLKKEAKDWNSEKHFPSKAIDKVWHAHQSFPMRYQHDMLAFCGHIIEPSLVLGKEVEQRCQEALKKHVTKAKTFVSEDDYPRGLHKKDFHNHEFWPAPKTAGAQCSLVHDCDLDDHCHFR